MELNTSLVLTCVFDQENGCFLPPNLLVYQQVEAEIGLQAPSTNYVKGARHIALMILTLLSLYVGSAKKHTRFP